MMMMGEGLPTVDVPPWPLLDDPTAGGQIGYHLPVSGVSAGDYLLNEAALAALQRYLPSNDEVDDSDADDSVDAAVDAYSCDEFRMYEFKVRRCARGRSHDWTECPYAHPGEKARRRDPRKFHYSGTACPDFRKGNCKRGDSCEFAHGVFECWLHPARYRTQPCKDGTACRRRVCFFAHTPDQLRVLPHQQQQSPRASAVAVDSYDGSPMRMAKSHLTFSSSPTSTLMSPPMSPTGGESPPASPSGVRRGSGVNEVLASLRKLQLGKVNSMPASSWGVPAGGFGSPGVGSGGGFRPGFCSLPVTPTRVAVGGGWVDGSVEEEEPVERVESGRALRAKMYERLSKEVVGREVVGSATQAPDLGWVSELVK